MEKTLKDLTWESHKKAEKTLFVKKLLKKQLSPYQYYVYLCNQAIMYWFLESYAEEQGIFEGIDEIKRAPRLLDDTIAIEKEYGFRQIPNTKTTERYISYIRQISHDKNKLLAHVYVRHLGDLSGGQIIKRFVPVSQKSHYDFDGDVEDIKTRFKEKTSPEYAIEANICFDFMIEFFEELADELKL